MFERYTEKARRVIFFGRYEASQVGQTHIETEHLLLGLLREDKALTNRLLRTHAAVDSIRKQIEKSAIVREKISTSADLPLSDASKRVLAYAAEEAERLGHKHIGTEHLLLGLLREEGCVAHIILKERGLEIEKVREELAKVSVEKSSEGGRFSTLAVQSLQGLYLNLTRKATEGALDPVVARDGELGAVIEVLSRRERRNPMLLGKNGAGKTAIVEALAQRIANGEVPQTLRDKQVMSLSAEALATLAPTRERFDDLTRLLESVAKSEELILFVDGLKGPGEATKNIPGEGLLGVLKFAMQEADLQCIAATTEQDHKDICSAYPAMDKVFLPLYIKPLGAAESLEALRARKERLEQFHGVKFDEETLEFAVREADHYLTDKLLPGKALELLDAAAAAVKVREQVEDLPQEIKECRQKLKFVQSRMDTAVEAHEFEKARFYAEEERKERRNLLVLEDRFGITNRSAMIITKADLEQVIARWAAYPYSA